jgi:5-methyltetrahydrofolate--homocysteine methyltransferase
MESLDALAQMVIDGDAGASPRLVQQLLDAGVQVRRILEEGLIAGMEVVGQKFEEHEFFVPEVLLAARAMQRGMDQLRPHLTAAAIGNPAHVVIGTVQGDQHDIGKNLVAMMLEGTGFVVTDLGKNVPADRFVSAVRETGATVVGLSTLITTAMPHMQRTVRLLHEASNAAGTRPLIVVGGAPVTAAFARQIGADGYADDATQAIAVVRGLLAEISEGKHGHQSG